MKDGIMATYSTFPAFSFGGGLKGYPVFIFPDIPDRIKDKKI